jgi:DNA-binding NtrC family response regulator
VTPSLAEQLADRPEDLIEMVRFLASQILGELTPGSGGNVDAETCAREVDALTAEAVAWIEGNLKDYEWPGNFRELSRCVRNVMIRGRYCPAWMPRNRGGRFETVDEFLRQIREIELTDEQLRNLYYALVYHHSDENAAAAGRLLDRDPRVVTRRLDQTFLERLRRLGTTEAG